MEQRSVLPVCLSGNNDDLICCVHEVLFFLRNPPESHLGANSMETLTRGLSDDTWSKCGSLPFILTQSCGEPLPFCSHRAPPVTGVPRTHSGTCHSRPRGHRTRGHHSSTPRGSRMLLLSPPRWELKIRCSRHRRRHSSLLHPGRGLWFGMIAPRPQAHQALW